MTSLRRARWSIVAAAVIAPLYAVTRSDTDSWWHLATGRFICATGHIPHEDPFSYTMRGEAWTCVGWLADIVFYGAWKLGGETGIGLLVVVAAFLTLALVGLGQAELRVPPGLAAAVVVVTGVVIQPRMSAARPLALAAVLLAAATWLLLRRFRTESRAWLFAGPMLVLAWAPSHPSCVLLPPLAWLLVAADVATRRRLRILVQDATTALLCSGLLVTLRSGRECIMHALDVDSQSAIVRQTVEWQLSWASSPGLHVPVGLIMIATVAGAFRARRSPLAVGLGLLGLLLALQFGRNTYEAMVLAAPLVGQQLRVVHVALTRRRRRQMRVSVVGAAFAALVISLHLFVGGPAVLNLRLGFGTDEGFCGPDVTDTLLQLPPGRALHDFSIGGYLIWRRIPYGAFADGRNLSLYTNAFIDANVLPLGHGIEAVDEVAARWDATYALAMRGQPFGLALMTSDTWIPLRHGDALSLFVRASRAAAVEQAGVPVLHAFRFVNDPIWLRRWYARILAVPDGRQRLALELAESHARYGTSRVLGRVLWEIRQQDPEFAERVLQDIEGR